MIVLERKFNDSYKMIGDELVVRLPNDTWFSPIRGSVVFVDETKLTEALPQIYGGYITGENSFIGYKRIESLTFEVFNWVNSKVTNCKVEGGFYGLKCKYRGMSAIQVGTRLLILSESLRVVEDVPSDPYNWFEYERFNGISAGMATEYGMFIKHKGTTAWFWNDEKVVSHEIAPPGHKTLPDGRVVWPYAEHWWLSNPEPQYVIGVQVNNEIYIGPDEFGRECFVNLKTKEVRRV